MKKTLIVYAITLLMIICSGTSFASYKLVFSSVLFRHGDRTPTKGLKKNPYHWKLGLGELTSEGMNEEFKLGSYLRSRYVDQFKLLSENYKNSQTYVRSADINRTLMSAESLLYGIYPLGTGPLMQNNSPALPNRFQPIPIHTVLNSDDKLLGAQHMYEKKIKELQQKLVYNTKEWISKQSELKPYFKNWSSISGLKINNLEETKTFASNIFIMHRHNIPLPTGINDIDKKLLLPLSSWIHAQQYKPQEIGHLISKYFFINLIKTINDFINKNSTYKQYLYSAHDTNILAALSMLKVPLSENPPYASFLAFELYEKDTKHYIKVIYNKRNVKLPINNINGYYSLNNFMTYLKTL